MPEGRLSPPTGMEPAPRPDAPPQATPPGGPGAGASPTRDEGCLSPSATRRLLEQLGHHPRHRFGQNFLVDGNIVRKSLALADVRPGDPVVEVGPGLGTLTAALLAAGARVWAVEIDPALAAFLRGPWAQSDGFPADRFHLLEGDAVAHPLAGWPGPDGPDEPHLKVVANLPYAISTPWLEAVLRGPLPERMVLMLQREAAERYGAEPGGGAFGAISIFLQSAYRRDPGHSVSRRCFFPEPDVDSVLLNLRRREAPFVFPEEVRREIRRIFTQRRKQIGALVRGRPAGEAWLERLAAAGLTSQARPEQIPVALWQLLAKPGS